MTTTTPAMRAYRDADAAFAKAHKAARATLYRDAALVAAAEAAYDAMVAAEAKAWPA